MRKMKIWSLKWPWILGPVGAKDLDEMNDQEKAEFKNLMRDLTNANTEALNSAKDNMQFSSGM